jgi:hypothetical protein
LASRGFTSRIRVLPLEEIRPHEEYDPQILLKITNSLMMERVIHDPILVDSENNVILDGTHRYWALTRLGCRAVPVALYDYSSPEVSIGCWYRCLSRAPSIGWASLMNTSPGTMEEGVSAVSSREALLSILYRDKSFTIAAKNFDIFEAYRLLSFFESAMKEQDSGLSFATEHDALERLKQGEVEAVLAPPPIKKSEVVQAARARQLFPIKSTRHVIRSRPIGIDVPLGWLMERMENLAPKIEAMLSSGTFRALPTGTIINGRRYEEEIYIFEPSSFGGECQGGSKGEGKVPRGSKGAIGKTRAGRIR